MKLELKIFHEDMAYIETILCRKIRPKTNNTQTLGEFWYGRFTYIKATGSVCNSLPAPGGFETVLGSSPKICGAAAGPGTALQAYARPFFWSKKPVLNSIHISCLGLCWIYALAPMAIPKQDIFPRVWQVMRSWAAVNWNLQILAGYLKQSQWFLLLFGSFKKSLSQHCNDGNEFCLFELSAVEKWFHAYSKWWMLDGCKSNPFPESKCGWLQAFCNEARHSGFQ